MEGRGVTGGGTLGTGVNGTGDVYGVTGSGSPTGVFGAGTENGVQAQGGTFGVFATGDDYGMYSTGTNYGVYATATAPGSTALAAQGASGGTALDVAGKAKFSRSGIATVPSGAKKIVVNMSEVTTSSMVLATSQQSGAFSVKNVSLASGSFTIFINKAPASPNVVKVAFFVLN